MNKLIKSSTANTQRGDRRQSVRYRIAGAVQFQWHGKDGLSHDGFGITRDIGKGGVFIESASIPPVAATLRLIVTLPAESKSGVGLQLGGVGFVRNVRQESCQEIGFGASAVFQVEVPMFAG